MTRNAAIGVLHHVVVAPLTRTVRNIPTELPLGPGDGLPAECVASFDGLRVVPKAYLVERVCALDEMKMVAACVALPRRGGLLRACERVLPDSATTSEERHADHRADGADDRPDGLAGHERALQEPDPLEDPDRADQHQEGTDDEADGSGHGQGPYSRGVLLFLRPITARLGNDEDLHGR